jgi:hypothetical protein
MYSTGPPLSRQSGTAAEDGILTCRVDLLEKSARLQRFRFHVLAKLQRLT